MQFPCYFERSKPAAPPIPALGSDSLPSGAPSVSLPNMLVTKSTTSSGFPVPRITIGYGYQGVGSLVALDFSLWLFDQGSGLWYAVNQGNTLPAPSVAGTGSLSYVSVPALGEVATGPNAGPLGGLALVLLVSASGASDGTYSFVMAPDLSSG